MQINNQTIHIHNIYFKFFNNYTHINQNLLIFKLSELLKKSDKHILLKNFNFYHSIWNDSQCFIKHNMTDELLHIINEIDLQFLILSNISTWKNRKQSFIINFIFSITDFEQQIISCCMNSSLKNDSNHYSIFTQFNFNKQSQIMKHCHNWKKMNVEDITAEIQHLQSFRNFHSTANIENYTDYLLEFINQLIENMMLWFKLILKYNCRWWTFKIQNAVHQIQVVCYQWISAKKIHTLNQIKKKSFTKSKQFNSARTCMKLQ